MKSINSIKLLVAAFAVLALFGTSALAQTTYTWNQTGSALWTTAGNWTPTRSTPANTDILVFNNGANTTVTAVPTQTIGKLQISAATTVNLQAAASNVVTIATAAADSFTVSSDSRLNNNGALPLYITLSANAFGSISGVISNSIATNTLTAASANGITFNSGATFIQGGTGTAGNAFGSGTANSVIFASGSTMIQNAGANPFQKTQPAAVVVFNTGSLFRAQFVSTPSWSGRTYANWEYNFSGGTVSPVGTATASFDDLTVTLGTVNGNMTATPGHRIKGNISVASGQTLTFTPATAGTFNLNGTSAQSINNLGTITNNSFSTLSMGNAVGVTLNNNMAIAGVLLVPNGGRFNVAATAVVSGIGAFTNSAGGTLGIASPDGITLSSALGPIQTTTRSYSASGKYIYNGAANQVAGDGLPATVGGLIVNNSGGTGNNTVTLAQATTVSGALQINNGILSIVGSANVGTLSFDSGLTQQATGTWGSTSSTATHQDDTHFAGTGTVNIQSAGNVTGYQYWDVNGNTLGYGGSGTWDTTTANWNLINDGSGAVQAYSSGVPIIFGGTPGTVSVDAAGIAVTALTAFDVNGYVLQGGGLTLSSGGTSIAVTNAAHSATINSILSGTAAFTKVGAGTVVLGGANNFTGTPTITSGTLKLGASEVIPDALFLVDNGALDLNNFNEKIAGVSGTGTINLPGSSTLTIGNDVTSKQFDGVISGTGGLIKTGTISQVLAGANTFSGGILVTQGPIYFRTNVGLAGPVTRSPGTGIITISGTGGIGANGGTGTLTEVTNAVVVNNAALLSPVSGSGFILSGLVSGAGGFSRTASGSGQPTLSGNNTYAGGVKIDARTLGIGHKNALGTGTLTLGDPTTAPANTIDISASIDLTGVNSLGNAITINQDFTLSGSNGLEFSGAVANSSGTTRTIIVSSTGTTKFSGVISGTDGITKGGISTLELSGANLYSGATTVSAGTLRINNTSGSGTGAGAVSVSATGTLTGAGSLSGSVAVDGTVAPGNSVGTLSTGAETWGGGGHYIWEINSAGGSAGGNPGWDKLSITGVLNITATPASQFNIDLTSLTLAGVAGAVSDFNNSTSRTFTLAQASGGITGFDTNAFLLNTNGFTNNLGAGSFTITTNATSILLVFTAPVAAQQPSNFVTTTAGHGTFQGSPNTSYTIQYTDSLSPIVWQTLTTVTTDGSGVGTFADASAPNGQPTRFYRVKTP